MPSIGCVVGFPFPYLFVRPTIWYL